MNDGKKPGSAKDSHYARLRRAHRDRKGAPSPNRTGTRPREQAVAPADGLVHLYGLHTVSAAIANPQRKIIRLLVTRNALARLDAGEPDALPFPVEITDPRTIDRIVGSEAVHQGVLAEAEPLTPKPLSALGETDLVVVLDQVTDPHNVGAILRTAVALGAGALITTARHSPSETGVLAKSASGALEHIDLIMVRNLAAGIEELHASGFTTLGLDSEGTEELEAALAGERIALVLGAEGKGLRHKTRETIHRLARLTVPGPIHSLNVSNAAAIALYAARGHLGRLR
ncbi:RNA methyltransferase [Nitratireductor mangrovi]|uniref:RNA methyltransferase n=1 Tax=Nitratireductor mangrovi TaxID=2599600 RepID=A0A5B8KVI5_9HYPH|nr:RNA methyltransferase [Nitratireductor mangrovi]QDY99581.1 RNA methyltransferase [Nitratireductor mangrovi]